MNRVLLEECDMNVNTICNSNAIWGSRCLKKHLKKHVPLETLANRPESGDRDISKKKVQGFLHVFFHCAVFFFLLVNFWKPCVSSHIC